jgi:hypothetical protein
MTVAPMMDRSLPSGGSSTGDTVPAKLLQRLERLQSFLLQDLSNNILRADIFETALSAGAFDRAEQQVNEAQERQLDPAG